MRMDKPSITNTMADLSSSSTTLAVNENGSDYTRLFGPFQATSDPISKTTFSTTLYHQRCHDYGNINADDTIPKSSFGIFGIYILYCSYELIARSNCEDVFGKILKEQHEEQCNCNDNRSHEENKDIFSNEAFIGNNLCFYIVIVSMDKESGRQKMVAMFEIIHDSKSIEVEGNNKDNHCDKKDREGQCYHHLFIQNKNGKHSNTISIRSHYNNPSQPRNSNIFLLRQQNQIEVGKGSPYQNMQSDFLMNTFFEYDLLVESLRAISTITSTINRNKRENLQEQYIFNDSNCSKTSKEERKISGIVIKLQKMNSTTKNMYKIIDSTVMNTKDSKQSNKEIKKRRRSENVEESCKDINASTSKGNKNHRTNEESANINSASPATFNAVQRNSFYFIIPEEKDRLTDYMFFLMAQVKRGELTAKDLDNARRKHTSLVVGYLGLRCRHCGGTERGHYFPTTSKNLQACPSMIFKHLMSCRQCPSSIKQQLKMYKTRHKTQVAENGSGIQITFFNALWERIRDLNFNGGDDKTRNEVFTILQTMIDSPIQKRPPTIVPSKEVPKAEHPVSEKDDIDKEEAAPKPLIQNPVKPLAPARVSAQMNISRIADEDISITTTEKHFDVIKSIPFQVNTSSISNLSSQNPGKINSLFESQQSLNITIDMLDAVADEILNTKPYPFSSELNKKTISSPDQMYWDKGSVRALRDLVDSDKHYRQMIDILATLSPEKISTERVTKVERRGKY